MQFSQTELETGLDGAEWGACRDGDLTLTHSFEECQFDGLFLKWREIVYAGIEKLAQVVAQNVVVNAIVQP